jgi:hypothetical protein
MDDDIFPNQDLVQKLQSGQHQKLADSGLRQLPQLIAQGPALVLVSLDGTAESSAGCAAEKPSAFDLKSSPVLAIA